MAKLKLQPVGAKALVKLDLAKTETVSGGIIIPEKHQNLPLEGKIVAVGKKWPVDDIPNGSRVLVDKFGGTAISLNGDQCVVLEPKYIHALL